MKNIEFSLSIVFYILSIVVGGIGFLFGVFMLMFDRHMGVMIILSSLINGVIVYGISKVLQLLEEIKRNITSIPINMDEEKENNSHQPVEVPHDEIENRYNQPVEWTLSKEQKEKILDYYLKDHQIIQEKDIIVSPFKNYCVVKSKGFLDVIELVDDNPVTLTRNQVENFKELRQWLEEHVFKKNKK